MINIRPTHIMAFAFRISAGLICSSVSLGHLGFQGTGTKTFSMPIHFCLISLWNIFSFSLFNHEFHQSSFHINSCQKPGFYLFLNYYYYLFFIDYCFSLRPFRLFYDLPYFDSDFISSGSQSCFSSTSGLWVLGVSLLPHSWFNWISHPQHLMAAEKSVAVFESGGCVHLRPDSSANYATAWSHGLFRFKDSLLCSQHAAFLASSWKDRTIASSIA